MATITITITESPLQLLSGIPSTITLEANVPATIFYTLDGSEPTVNSHVAIDTISMPTNSGSVVLKTFATNGVDSCPIITQEYKTNIVPARQPHDTVIEQTNCQKATYPFGSSTADFNQSVIYENTGGVLIDSDANNRVADGYDGTATKTGAGFFSAPKSQYAFVFSETNDIGTRGKGIGTLPGRVVYSVPRNNNDPPIMSNMNSPLFNPKALVMFQDSSEEPYDTDIPKINRSYFDLEDQAKARDGSLLTNTESVSPQGGFIRAHYNPAKNTMTYYYYDNRVARWVISTEPYHYTQNPTSNMAGMVSRVGRDKGVGFVFKWIPFQYRCLI
jgi:hypothetical protein